MARHAVAVLILLVLTACNQVPAPRDLPLDRVRRGMVTDAVNRFGEALNRGACQSIYEDASIAFQQLEPSTEWRGECERMRASLGSWESFGLRTASATGTFTVRVDGTAVFARGRCRLGTIWSIENGRARLFRLLLQGPGGTTTIIAPQPPPMPPPTDAPLKRPVVAA